MNINNVVAAHLAAKESSALSSTDVIAIATGVVALLALITSFYFGWLQRRSYHLSAKPILDFELGTQGTLLSVFNDGIGPAIVDSFVCRSNGQTIDLLTDSGMQTCCELLTAGTSITEGLLLYSISNNSVIGVGRKCLVISTPDRPQKACRMKIRENYSTFELEVHYRCIYGNKYKTIHSGFE
ncbi:hypothetical protein [Stenotrophomonas nematodicola]|uniref:hypothetical protein n=1 Tax=Stenotrophomonas nematodicola TaxID=2656746 RepID=UPI001290914B|nr:hypothetical protein [Stenotrophomonas nematodicola]